MFPVYANDLNLTITNSDGTNISMTQDGEDNNIDLDMDRMNNAIMQFTQIGDDNNIDIDVDGRTSNGSSIYITQTGDNKSYSASLYCAHAYCTMTLNQ
tara:strand:- start:198 stop:491 length:294 start_codon:yes stop_codon:yes gene_type:complete